MLELNKIHCGDCLEVMKTFPDNCISSIVTDPPYGLNSGGDVLGFGLMFNMLCFVLPGLVVAGIGSAVSKKVVRRL